MSDSDDLILSIVEALTEAPGTTARTVTNRLRRLGRDVDKGHVNSILYRHTRLFHNDGSVPPRWSLASMAPMIDNRNPYRVSGISVDNWKAFEHTSTGFAGVTLIYGENSSGKSSLFQALLLMKQTWGHGELQLEGKLGSFGWYQHVVHRHDLQRDMQLRAWWGAPGSEDTWTLVFYIPHGPVDYAFNPEHPIGKIGCGSPEQWILLVSAEWADDFPRFGDVDDGWLAFRMNEGGPGLRDHIIVLNSDDRGFPDIDDVRGVMGLPEGVPTEHPPVDTYLTIKDVLAGATAMFDAVEHIGPARAIPQRGISLSWAREHAEYLARLFENKDLVLDVNEWLGRFEIPYALEITRYGQANGDESFELDLRRGGGERERVQLRDVGFGVSQLLPIIVQLLGHREKTILIEEPEAHVHPRLQSVLGDLFVTSTQDYGNVVVVETHSEPILLRLQRRIAEGRIESDDVAVLHVTRTGESSHVEGVPIQENGQLDYQWPGGFFDDRMDDLVAILDPRPDF